MAKKVTTAAKTAAKKDAPPAPSIENAKAHARALVEELNALGSPELEDIRSKADALLHLLTTQFPDAAE